MITRRRARMMDGRAQGPATPSDGPRRALQLTDLPSGPMAHVVGLLEPRDRVALAATSSACMSAVLGCCPGGVQLTPSKAQVADQITKRLHQQGCVAANARIGRVSKKGWVVVYRAGADPRDEASVVGLRKTNKVMRYMGKNAKRLRRGVVPPPPLTDGMTALEHVDVSDLRWDWLSSDAWLPRGARGSVKTLNAAQSGLQRVPEGMGSLEEVDVRGCTWLEKSTWLPSSSARNLKVLKLYLCDIKRLPPGLGALEELALERRDRLGREPPEEAWLPEDSGERLQKLVVTRCPITHVPPHVRALKVLRLVDCQELSEDFLDERSCASLVEVDITRSSVRRLPAGMVSLQRLTLCPGYWSVSPVDLFDDWLPVDSARELRYLNVSCTNVRRVPATATHLETLIVRECKDLDERWIDDGVAAAVQELDVSGSSVRSLPGGMTQLKKLDVSRSSVRCLPDGMTQLKKLDVSGCDRFNAGWLSASVRETLRELNASATNLRELPAGMTALEVLLVTYCKSLDANKIPESSKRKLRVLRASETATTCVRGMPALEELDVSHCDVWSDFIDRQSARGLKTLELYRTGVPELPEGLEAIEEITVGEREYEETDLTLDDLRWTKRLPRGKTVTVDWFVADTIEARRIKVRDGMIVSTEE